MLLNSPGACFVNACELAFKCPADILARDYKDLLGESEHDPDVDGYHSSIVNMAFLERFGRGITEIDVNPTIDGHGFSGDVPGYVTDWFKRPMLQAVCTGDRISNGEPHAIAIYNGVFVDSNGEPLKEPNIAIKHVWLLGLPAFVPDAKACEDQGDGETS